MLTDPAFSVLICTYERPRLLERCLTALLERSAECPDEVIVVNGGGAEADAVVRRHAQVCRADVVLLKTANVNLATSRNVGLPRCRGRIIAMTDDDAEVFPDWVTQLKRAHAEQPAAGAVGGPVVSGDPPSLLGAVADRVTFPSFPGARDVRTLPGVNIAYKREVIERIGPQDASLFRGEDVDYNWRVQQAGYAIYYDPAVRVLHHHRATLGALLRQHYMYGRAYYLVRRKWPEMYCVYPHGLRRLRDWLKAANFFAAALSEPSRVAAEMTRPADRLLAFPLLVANQIAWRGGMVRQKLRQWI